MGSNWGSVLSQKDATKKNICPELLSQSKEVWPDYNGGKLTAFPGDPGIPGSPAGPSAPGLPLSPRGPAGPIIGCASLE